VSPVTNGWYRVDIPLTALEGANTTITQLHLQDTTGAAQPTFYVDNLGFVRGTEPNYIALTFDDGPSDMTKPILDRLAARGVRVTMFVTGENASQNPDAIRRIVEEGHVIGNHSWNHPDLTTLSLSKVTDQLARTNKVLRDLGAPTPGLFRPPFGNTNGGIAQTAKGMEMTQTLWNIDAHDWNRLRLSADQLCKNVLGAASPGGIILMHDLDYNTSTPEALDCIIDTLRSQKFEFGRIQPTTEWNDALGGNVRMVPW
jgi:peptidoglycan/xylan/chitin deacetylase (PgdA/CDA1 family)